MFNFLHFIEKDLTNPFFVRGAIPNTTRVLILCGYQQTVESIVRVSMCSDF